MDIELIALSRFGNHTTLVVTADGKTLHRDAVILDSAADRRRFVRAVVKLLGLPAADRKAAARHFDRELVELADVPAPPAGGGFGPRPGSGAGKPTGPTVTPDVLCMADVEPQAVPWLWPGRIPLGRLTLIVGRPGGGKSFLTCEMAARVTLGGFWPDGGYVPQGDVLFLCAEDDPADTIAPRLIGAGADRSRVHLLRAAKLTEEDGRETSVAFDLSNVELLRATLAGLPACKLVVIDPIGSYLGGGVDAHRDNETRAVLAPLAALASEFGVAVVLVCHSRKATASFADDTALGSRAFTGLARSVLHLSADENDRDRKLLLPGKCNLGKPADGLAFKIEGEPAAIRWEDGTLGAMHADDVLIPGGSAPRGPEPAKRTAAADWLRDVLASGPVPVDDIRAAASDAGMSWATVRRAQDELGVTPRKAGFSGGWTWSLPGNQPAAEPARAPKPWGPWSDAGYALRNGMFGSGDHDAGDGGLPD